jgi:N-acetylated-alpha-linked acidic dipeptidase
MAFFNSARRSTPSPTPSHDDAASAVNPLLGSPVGTSVSFSPNSGYRPPTVRSARNSEDSLQDYRKSDDDDLTSLGSDDDSSEFQGETRDIDDLDYQNGGIELGELHNGDSARRRSSRWGTLRRRVDKWTKHWSWNRPRWLFSALPRLRFPEVPESWKNGGAVIGRFIGLLVLIASGYALFALAIFPAAQNELASMFDPEGVRQFAQGAVDGNRIREFLRHVTSYDHVAGTRGSFYLAEWIQDVFLKAGLDAVHLDRYDAYLNYPRVDGRRVAIIEPPEYRWEAKLEEEPAYPGEAAGKTNTLVFHAHSRSGNVSGPLIYFNYGSRADYRHVCSNSGIRCNGSIAIVRQYGSQSDPAFKVKAAEEWNIKGVLIYSDPAEDGFRKGKVWPEGRWRPDDSVLRGGVTLTPWVVGDPLTPGWASKPGANRLPIENNPGLVNIPSLPLASRDAQRLLQSLKGHGQKVSQHWQGGVPDVEWWTGDDKSPVVLLENNLDDAVEQKVYNVMGKIEGLESAGRAVIVGNHRDSWCFGAADP